MSDWNTYCAAVYAARTDTDEDRANRMTYLECLYRIHEAMCEHACSLYAAFNGYLDQHIVNEADSVCESMTFVHRTYEREMSLLRY